MCAYDEDLPPFDSAQRSLRKNTMLNILTEPVIRLDLSGGNLKPGLLPVGPDLPEPHGHRRGHRPGGTSLCDPRVRCAQLPD